MQEIVTRMIVVFGWYLVVPRYEVNYLVIGLQIYKMRKLTTLRLNIS